MFPDWHTKNETFTHLYSFIPIHTFLIYLHLRFLEISACYRSHGYCIESQTESTGLGLPGQKKKIKQKLKEQRNTRQWATLSFQKVMLKRYLTNDSSVTITKQPGILAEEWSGQNNEKTHHPFPWHNTQKKGQSCVWRLCTSDTVKCAVSDR